MKVFLSYASEDEELAERVVNGLGRQGLTTWYEIRDAPGENWFREIGEALNQCEAMVVLITPDALKDKSVWREVEYALGNIEYRNRLIPVNVDNLSEAELKKVPWIVRKKLPLVSMNSQNPEEGVTDIVSKIGVPA